METLDFIVVKTNHLQLISSEQAWHYRIIPVDANEKQLTFHIDESVYSEELKAQLAVLFGKRVILIADSSEVIQKTLSKYFRKNDLYQNRNIVKLNKVSDTNDFLLDILSEAKDLNCSDIHFESYEERCRIRFRIDGHLIERFIIPKHEFPSIVNKLKIKANLDISEKRLPQDGRINFDHKTTKFDIRVSILPTLHGEKIVLRILNNDATAIDIQSLGFQPDQLEAFLSGIQKTSGIVLISGPTGSGKTTTLYGTLKILNTIQSNILTIEDPVEYTLEGINQVQLKESIGLTFASALRTFLRQDPDIIMVGEIRDKETAQIAIRAALTGHLVLSTIHTNSAWGTISRLRDLDIPAYLITSTLNLSVAQRLIRLLCHHCKRKVEITPKLIPPRYHLPESVKNHYVSVGCEKCYYTGYRGRRALYEVIPIDSDISHQIESSENEIGSLLKEKNIITLAESALLSFIKGETSAEEILSILTTI